MYLSSYNNKYTLVYQTKRLSMRKNDRSQGNALTCKITVLMRFHTPRTHSHVHACTNRQQKSTKRITLEKTEKITSEKGENRP